MQTVNISANIPLLLSKKLEKVAAIEERAKSFYIRKALEQYLSQRLEDIENYSDAKKAYDEFIASGEPAVSFDEVFKNVK